jgi:hypothetical protein
MGKDGKRPPRPPQRHTAATHSITLHTHTRSATLHPSHYTAPVTHGSYTFSYAVPVDMPIDIGSGRLGSSFSYTPLLQPQPHCPVHSAAYQQAVDVTTQMRAVEEVLPSATPLCYSLSHTYQQAVDVTTQMRAVGEVLLEASEQQQHEPALDDVVAEDGGGQGGAEQLQHVGAAGQLADVPRLLHGVLDLVLLGQLVDRHSDNNRLKTRRGMGEVMFGCLGS